MKFTGKELFELKCPPNKIKFLIDKEFNNREELLAEINSFNKPKGIKIVQNLLINWVFNSFPHLPMVLNGNMPVKMSKSELRRIMDSGGLLINGKFTKADKSLDDINFPIKEFIWFPKSDRKTSWV